MKQKTLYIMALLATLTLAATVFAENAQAPKPDNPAPVPQKQGVPRIHFEATRYEFGSVVEGHFVTRDFVVHNQGDGPLEIDQVKTS